MHCKMPVKETDVNHCVQLMQRDTKWISQYQIAQKYKVQHDKNKDLKKVLLDILFHCWQARHAFHRINLDEINLGRFIRNFYFKQSLFSNTMNSSIVSDDEESLVCNFIQPI